MTARFVLRMAWRETRASWRRLIVFFIAVALGGIAVTIYARLDDWKRGQR